MKLVKHDLQLVKPCWLLVIIFLSLMCLGIVSRISCSIVFPGIMVTDHPVVSWLLFTLLALLEYWDDICILPVFGSSPSCHDWSKSINNGLAMSSDSPLSICESIPSGPMDLRMPRLLKYSLSWSPSTKGTCSLFQSFCSVSETWDSWRLVLVKAKTFRNSVPQPSPCPLSPVLPSCWQWVHIFLRLSFVSNVLIVTLLAVFYIPGYIKFHLAFGFSNYS